MKSDTNAITGWDILRLCQSYLQTITPKLNIRNVFTEAIRFADILLPGALHFHLNYG